MNLWLDDMRPAPEGWHHVKTVQEAKDALLTGSVVRASLDHDLGACPACLNGRTPEQWLTETNYTQMPNCEHFGNGYQLICWMEENGIWPPEGTRVHSANPAGSFKMRQAIEKAYSGHG